MLSFYAKSTPGKRKERFQGYEIYDYNKYMIFHKINSIEWKTVFLNSDINILEGSSE